MSTSLPKYTLRINKILLEKIKYIAESEGRSANKEIEQLIKKHVENYEQTKGEIKVNIEE
ncbi:TPA: Arc family DNA-binding protein [Clostridioides difficile]|uniref:Arc family DNA-binding protein n=1 Tax=Clostridioides TaxID=1870884 RepID=UPI00094477DA|nr:Arc family DNA-binding protein [Clostridioides difficile]MCC0652672.1 Arc family DNA-binding protein [Clostridioides sp. ES-S-0001-03]MCC0677943.1 Arc family DNA-binding protein [Clostridioides sp. ES-W-0018-02]MCC0712708.1 Arc family DNA-binding protein [Clostridioides sp. ES-W-0017-02]EGT4599382.1 Arc family DNA-binding protein [Clostridioides difficile]MBH7464603.1 Arc family DNA-binding protein [Clostridioides difficile]